jgi:hypothetical protein
MGALQGLEEDAKGGADPNLAGDFDPTLVLLDNAIHSGKS